MITVKLADGSSLSAPLPERLASWVRGVDADGDVVIADADMSAADGSDDYLYALTPCCLASGKGSIDSMSGIVCRKCYSDVDAKFGGRAHVAIAVVA